MQIYLGKDSLGFEILDKLDKGLVYSDSSEGSHTDGFQLSHYMQCKIERGAEDSANITLLTLNLTSAGLQGNYLMLKIKFDNPLLVSIGSRKDTLVTTIIDGSFFSSPAGGSTIPSGTTFRTKLPKM